MIFNRKLKQRIHKLENMANEQKTEIAKLNTEVGKLKTETMSLICQVKNPAKFKIGDRVGDLGITNMRFKHIDQNLAGIIALTLLYMFNCNKKNIDIEKLNQRQSSYWEYDVVNLRTFHNSTKKESELI